MVTVGLVSFRLGVPDGVSVVAASWVRALGELGYGVRTVAGEGTADVVLPGLALGTDAPVEPDELRAALCGVDVTIVENVLTIPINLPVSRAVAAALAGRPALLHHHDPPWQRPQHAHITELPPRDPAWCHVTINRLTEGEMAERGFEARAVYNGIDVDVAVCERAAARRRLGFGADELVLLHPVRAIERKNVPGAVALAEAVGATYWLPGPVEDGYGPVLERILATARTSVRRDPIDHDHVALAYAAADAILYPSFWEGFGLPPMEAAVHHRPVVVGDYPVSRELRALGFWWLAPDDVAGLRAALAHPPRAALARNAELVRMHLSYEAMRDELGSVLAGMGFPP